MFWLRNKTPKVIQIPDNQLCLRAIVLSDQGCVRSNNEDNACFLFLNGGKTSLLAVLADGMGGYERGEVASKQAVKIVTETVNNPALKPLERLANAFLSANRQIYRESKEKEELMGTTCTSLLIEGQRVYCAHIGDSRLYLLQGNRLQQVTNDHTWVQEMLKQGKLTPEQTRNHPDRNMLSRALGIGNDIQPDIFSLRRKIQAGNRFLLCSDGLYDVVGEQEIEQIMMMKSIKLAGSSLIALAKERGGYDNITVLIVEITSKRSV